MTYVSLILLPDWWIFSREGQQWIKESHDITLSWFTHGITSCLLSHTFNNHHVTKNAWDKKYPTKITHGRLQLEAITVIQHYVNFTAHCYNCAFTAATPRDLFYKGFMSPSFKSCNIASWCYMKYSYPVMPEFCTCHDSSAVMTCAKFGHDWMRLNIKTKK